MQTTNIKIPHTWESGSHSAEKATYARNAIGNVIAATRQTGNMTAASGKTYDKLGRITFETDQAGLITKNSYTNNGLNQAIITPVGATLITTY